jgi:hypothetical protein
VSSEVAVGVACCCQQCGAAFRRFPSQIAKGGGKFCSWECMWASRRHPREECQCEVCGVTFAGIVSGNAARTKFCSLECRNRRHGDADDRFWSKVLIGDGCWEWQGPRDGDGYGLFKIGGKMVRASRVAFEMFNGPLDPALLACHTCDNPPCLRPDHLFSGTHADNHADRGAKGRTATNANGRWHRGVAA